MARTRRGSAITHRLPLRTARLETQTAKFTVVDEKLAEELGLARAAETAIRKVETLARKGKETELAGLMQEAEVVGFMKTYLEDGERLPGEHSLRLAADEDPQNPPGR